MTRANVKNILEDAKLLRYPTNYSTFIISLCKTNKCMLLFSHNNKILRIDKDDNLLDEIILFMLHLISTDGPPFGLYMYKCKHKCLTLLLNRNILDRISNKANLIYDIHQYIEKETKTAHYYEYYKLPIVCNNERLKYFNRLKHVRKIFFNDILRNIPSFTKI